MKKIHNLNAIVGGDQVKWDGNGPMPTVNLPYEPEPRSVAPPTVVLKPSTPQGLLKRK